MTDARVLRPGEAAFPRALLAVDPPPEVLYARGDLSVLDRPMAAIVGSRQPTRYGIKVAYEAAYEAARAGIVVVSGLARGLDGRAHRGALDGGGATVAVLGCGLDVPYPRANLDLLRAIPEHGLLLTERPPGEHPKKWAFPARNRLIAGLARCLLVVEGRSHGGTSNTVTWMQTVGRAVLAVPGRIDDPVAEGPNLLLRDGATPYLSPADLLVEFGLTWDGGAHRPAAAESERSPAGGAAPAPDRDALAAMGEFAAAEATVFDLITPDPVHVDRIADRAALDQSALLAALSSLEIKGLVTQLPGKRFQLAS